jgi:hypothetical protein
MSDKFMVVRPENGGCILCLENGRELYLVREVKGGRLTALCSRCLLHNLDHYMLDNTREWPFLIKQRT